MVSVRKGFVGTDMRVPGATIEDLWPQIRRQKENGGIHVLVWL
jgi:hypothetical protein